MIRSPIDYRRNHAGRASPSLTKYGIALSLACFGCETLRSNASANGESDAPAKVTSNALPASTPCVEIRVIRRTDDSITTSVELRGVRSPALLIAFVEPVHQHDDPPRAAPVRDPDGDRSLKYLPSISLLRACKTDECVTLEWNRRALAEVFPLPRACLRVALVPEAYYVVRSNYAVHGGGQVLTSVILRPRDGIPPRDSFVPSQPPPSIQVIGERWCFGAFIDSDIARYLLSPLDVTGIAVAPSEVAMLTIRYPIEHELATASIALE